MNFQLLRTVKLPDFNEECLLVKGVGLENLPGPGEPRLLITQPCASVEGKISCEFRFGVPGKGVSDDFYNFPTLSSILSTYSEKFTETRISSKLGVARIQWRGKTIIISKNGRIVIRESDGEEDAKTTIDFLSRLLTPSVICAKCGRTLLDCATASCGECSNQQVSFPVLPSNVISVEVIREIRILTTVLDTVEGSLLKNIKLGETFESFESLSAQCHRSSKIMLDIIVQSEHREELATAILVLRCAWDLSLIFDLLDQVRLHKYNNGKSEISTTLLKMLGLWLTALKGSIDSIVDKGAREHSIERWAQFNGAWSVFCRNAEHHPVLKAILSLVMERWTASVR